MAIKFTAESFLEIVRRCRLVPPDQLKRRLAEFQQSGVNIEDSREIADALVDKNVVTRWQADKLLQGKHKGFFLGKYRLLSLLGKGGMGSVYLAEHTLMRRRCAIKVLPAKRVHDSSYLARFHREAQAVAALDHVNIVRAYDVDKETEKDAEIHFLVMEYVNGRDLLDIVTKDGPMKFAQAADYIRQSADGLIHAHQAGMVHRDIKPGNLLVNENQVVKILDLGLARFFGAEEDDEESLTVAHDEKVLGTADYLSPEQALDSHSVDARADIYSLGCTFYFLLTGHPPFTEGTLAQRLMAHQTKEPPALEKECPEVPADLRAIIKKMMAKTLDERYQSANEVNEALKQWLLKNAGDDWRKRNSAIIGSDSSTTHGFSSLRELGDKPPAQKSSFVETKAASQDSPALSRPPVAAQPPAEAANAPTNSPAAAAPAEAGDDANLAAFLANLGDSESKSEQQPAAPAADVVAASSAPVADDKPVADLPPAAAPVVDVTVRERVDNAAQTEPAPPAAAPVAMSAPVVQASPVAAQPVAAQPVVEQNAAPVAAAVPVATAEPPVVAAQPVERSFANRGKKKRRSGRSNADMFRPIVELCQKKQVRIGAAAAVGLIGLVGLIYAGATFFGGDPNEPKEKITQKDRENEDSSDSTADSTGGSRGSRTGKTISGGKIEVGPGGTFKTIAAALKHARDNYSPGASRKAELVIVVAGGKPYAERIEVDGNYPQGISLVAKKGDRPVLSPTGTGPLIKLDGVERFKIEGFELNATGKPTAVELSSYLNACSLKNLKITGFTKNGVLANGAVGVGAYDQEVHLEQLELHAGDPAAVGMKFQQGNNDTQQVLVSDCRFLGPMSAGIIFQNSPSFVAVRRTMFSELGTGIKFDGSNMRLSNITVGNCTFFKLDRGIVFTSLPAPASQGLMITRNIFSKLKGVEVIVENEFDLRTMNSMFSHASNAATAWNWSSRAKPDEPIPGAFDLFSNNGRRGEKFEFVSTDPGNDRFLAPPVSAQWTRGLKADPKSDLKPYAGAVGP